MRKYQLEISSIKDIDFISDIEEREEAQEKVEDEIEWVYKELQKVHTRHNYFSFDQIDDYRFNIEVDTVAYTNIMQNTFEYIKDTLEYYDIAEARIEEYNIDEA